MSRSKLTPALKPTAANTDRAARRLAERAELNKFRPDFISQADWDKQMDEWQSEDARTVAAMVKSAKQYDLDHPDEVPEPASPGDCAVVTVEEFLAANGLPPLAKSIKKARAKQTKAKRR